jgi:hypothetical protein
MRQTTLGLALVLGLGAAAPAAGQVRGLPVYNSGIPTGLGLFADVGVPNDATGDNGTALGATARLGAGPFGATGTVSYLTGNDPSVTSVGGTLNYKFFGGPLVPLTATLQGGVGYSKSGGIRNYHVPIGVGIGLTIPNPVLAIKPWIAPRVDIAHTSIPGGVGSNTDTNFGISGGVELNLLNGIGVHAAYDRVFATGDDPGIFAAGLHYQFRIPGL